MRYIKFIIIIVIFLLVLSTIKALYESEIPAEQLYYDIELKNNIVYLHVYDSNSAYVLTDYRIKYTKKDIVDITVYHSPISLFANAKQQFDINIKKSEKTKIYFKGKGQIKHIYG